MRDMFLFGRGVDENVCNDKLSDHVPEDVIYKAVEQGSALYSPYGMTQYSKWPVAVLKAIFHRSPSRIQTMDSDKASAMNSMVQS